MRLFVAVLPPDDVLDQLAGLPRAESRGARWTTRKQWHVTLRFLGELTDEAELVSRLEPAVSPLAACDAALGPGVALLNPRIVSVDVAGLDAIADATVAATRDLGRPPEDRPFRGHITLARLKGLRAREARALTGAPIEATWPVTSIHVMRSQLSPKGARYESLVALPLGERGLHEGNASVAGRRSDLGTAWPRARSSRPIRRGAGGGGARRRQPPQPR